jgi:hypothetical protein
MTKQYLKDLSIDRNFLARARALSFYIQKFALMGLFKLNINKNDYLRGKKNKIGFLSPTANLLSVLILLSSVEHKLNINKIFQ